MNFNHPYARMIAVILVASLMLQLTSCGTLIYPERDGQARGRIDPTVAILDGIGLIFFIIPGLVAYAIDFHTKAIYLPADEEAWNKGEEASSKDALKVIPLPSGEIDVKTIEALLSKEIGQKIRFSDNNLQAFAFNSTEELKQQVANINANIALQRRMARATN